MSEIKLTINGKEINTKPGSTVLEVAELNGIEIPTLCHDKRLEPSSACRICLIEIEGARVPMPACSTPAADKMVIRTQTDQLSKLRRMALELLLSDHYGDCIAPCKLACPAGIDIQGFIAYIANEENEKALKLIKESNPLPLVCGRVCPRFCELKCRRNIVDEPVAINALKRFVADIDINSTTPFSPECKASSGHEVAIIGGGPAGLTAAYYLSIEGHSVTIFEANPKLGGMLRYGIPEYRLPKSILDKEIEIITGLCKQVRLNTRLGKHFSLESLRKEGYEAIFIALGSQLSQKMNIKGEDLLGVLSGIEFLKEVALHNKINIGQKVAVIGGGNTAIDAARTALRLGASEVSVVYRRSLNEMPANEEEIEAAEAEGVKLLLLTAPIAITGKNGKATSLECIKMQLGEPDKSGRRKPQPLPGSEYHLEVDTVIAAIGQTTDIGGMEQISTETGKNVNADGKTYATVISGVFAGGDCVTGPATAVEAIAAGKKAANSINQFLNGEQIKPPARLYNCSRGELNKIDINEYKDTERLPRNMMPTLPAEERRNNFNEIETGFNTEMAMNEVKRCLACGCQHVFQCQLRNLATEYQVDDSHYAGYKRHISVVDEHRYIAIDPNKCILCGRCVRICDEVQDISAIGYINRGFNTGVGTAAGIPLSETVCESCGQCISSCPTGALTEKINLSKAGPWKLQTIDTICPYCNTGCNLQVNLACDKIISITTPPNNPVNQGNLCKRGKFDYIKMENDSRVINPLIRNGNSLEETSWENALEIASRAINNFKSRNADKLAVLASGQLTNEENYLIQKLARLALHTNNIGGSGSPVMVEGFLKNVCDDEVICSYQNVRDSDLIILLGSDISKTYPVVASQIRRAVKKGSKLITISQGVTKLDHIAQIDLRINSKTTLAFLRAVLNYIIHYNLVDNKYVNNGTSGFKELSREMKKYSFNDVVQLFWIKPARIVELIHLFIRAKKPVIIANTENLISEEWALIRDLMIVTGNLRVTGAGIVPLRTPGNAQGQIDMGVTPNYLPGKNFILDKRVRESLEKAWNKTLPANMGKDTEHIIDGLSNVEIEGVVIFGMQATGEAGNHVFESARFSILFDSTVPQNPPYPSIVLPLANFLESNGTFTNSEGRIQIVRQVFNPPSAMSNWQRIAELSGVLGYKMDYNSLQQITSEIASIIPAYGTALANLKPDFSEQNKKNSSDNIITGECNKCRLAGALKNIGRLVGRSFL